jgi:hypothetical protein
MGYRLRRFLVVSGVGLASLALFGLVSGPAWGEREQETGKRTSRLPTRINAAWQHECGSCHVAYPPGLLPQASWQRIIAGLDRHFGENAALPPHTAAEIGAFLAAHGADAGGPAAGSGAGVAENSAAPLRITETDWFRREHREIGAAVWKRPAVGSPANCAACHREADQGNFNEHGVKIPG